jgi:4,5:9,10-diseco-3-hydroxy-5,9,17-trioxoandrosta-1(10),2-diene-4-oate hydrolase
MGYTRQETSKFVKAGKIRMHYNEAGSGEPLICIHGGGPGATSWSNFSRNIDELAGHFRTILVDLPGFGESEGMKIEEPLYGALARSVRDFMDALDIRRAHFIGNSLGGGTVVKLAMDYPDRAKRLVLLGPGCGLPMFSHAPSEGIKHLFGFYEPPGPTIEKLKAFIEVMIYDRSALTDELLAERFAAATRPETIANFPIKRATPATIEPLWKDIASVKHKSLVLWGREDRTVPFDTGLILLSQMPDVRFVVFSRCGHWVQWEKTADFNRMVISFLTAAE